MRNSWLFAPGDTYGRAMGAVNDGLRFLLELAVLGSLGYWGFSTHRGVLRWLFGLGTPVLAAVVWAVFVTPQGALATHDPVRLILEIAIFGSAVAALFGAGHRRVAGVFGVLVIVHLVLTFVLNQR